MVKNNILYYNNNSGLQLAGLTEKQINYCCIPDCNDVNPRNNINDEPVFAYSKAPYGFYHLRYGSPCRNSGSNTGVGYDEMDLDNTDRIAESTVDIGADEVSCPETYDPNDWTYDGTINLEEFTIFSSAWESHDPNTPGLTTDPNFIGYPNYVAPDTLARWRIRWNPKCNLDTDGGSEYAIDMEDLEVFLYNWLWRACWYDDYSLVMYGQSYTGGGEQMMMSIPIPTPELGMLSEQPAQTETAVPAPSVIPAEAGIQPLPVETEAVVELPAKSIAEQIADLQDAIQFLETIWDENPDIRQEIQVDDWQEFMDTVYNSLTELEQSDIITQDEMEAEQ